MMFDFSVATPTDIQHKTQLNQGGKTNQGEVQSGLPVKSMTRRITSCLSRCAKHAASLESML